jgi:hypothetical protein
MISTLPCWNRRLRRLLASASVAAVLIMGAVTVAVRASDEGASPVVSADHTSTVTTPPQVVGQPTKMAPGWQGRWAGTGPFHGGRWPGN